MDISTILILKIYLYNERNERGGERSCLITARYGKPCGTEQYQLLKAGIDNKTLDSLKKNKNITMVTLEKLCRIIDCSPNDVVRFL